MRDGWIKLYRKTLTSDMYRSLTAKQRDVMIQILLLANHSNNKWEWQGEVIELEAGQLITSISKLADKCSKDVKEQSVKSALKKLEMWGFITDKATKTGRMITVLNWERYQGLVNLPNKESHKEITTIKKEKKTKNIIDRKSEFEKEVKSFGDYSAKMLGDFVDYWTEENRSKTKMKFEQQQTWNTGLRLKRWAKNNFLGDSVDKKKEEIKTSHQKTFFD